MFRDLKEYQEIHNLYQNSVYLSEDERKFIETVNETEFTDEELLYFSENTEEVINHLIESEILNENIFKLGGLVKGIKNIKGIKNVSKIKGFDKFKNIKVPSKNVKNIKLPSKGYELQSIGGFKGFKDSPVTSITNKLKDKLNVKGLLKGKKDKISKSVKSTKSKVKGSKPKGRGISPGVAGAIGGSAVLGASELMNQSSKRATEAELAAIKKQLEKLQKERDDRIDKDVEKYVKDRKNPEGINKDLTIDKSKEKKEVKPETKTEVKPETKTEVKPETKTETKPTNPSGKVIPKPKKPLSDKSPAAKAGIPKERRQKFANQNAAFQATKRKDSGYTKMDFIKDFPNSQTAKKYRKGEPIPGFKYKKNLKSSYEYDTHKGLNEMGPEGLIPKDSFSEKPKPKEKEKPVRKPSNLGAASLIPPESFKKEELEELTPYDIVLEYLLYTEQVATIEEANYVMTEMDGKTINDIVKEVTQSLEEGIGSVRILPALGKMALGAAAVKGISSYLGKKSGESSIKGSQPMKGGEKGGDPIKDLIPNLKKNKEATEKAIEKM